MRYILIVSLLGSLAACSSDPPPPPPVEAKPVAGVLDEQMKAIDKAKQVEADAAERKRKMDEQIDGSSN